MLAALMTTTFGDTLAAEDTAALVEKVRLLEARLRQVEAASAVLEVGAVDLTIPVGETNVSMKVPFHQQPGGPVIILTGETGTAGSWVVTKCSRITEDDFELNVIDNENKTRDVPYHTRIGYVVLRADSVAAATPTASKTPQVGKPAGALTWADYRKKCGMAAQKENEATSEAVFRKEYAGRDVVWSGSVVAVSESVLGGGYSVTIRMQPSDSLVADVLLNVPKSLEGSILALKEGDTVKFTGRIKSQGGPFSYHTLGASALEKD